MKKFILIFMLCLYQFLWSGDIFNQEVDIDESYSQVVITFQFTWEDSSSAYHTKPIFIGDCNDSDGYVSAVQSGTGDANVIYHFTGVDNIASETAIWTTSTPADLDAVSSTAKFDTIGVEQGVDVIAFHNMRWLVIEVVGGGTNNHVGRTFTLIMNLKKDDTFVRSNGDYIKVCKTASTHYTNP